MTPPAVAEPEDGPDDGAERRWLHARRHAQEERERAEAEARIDRLPFTLRQASRAVDDLLARLLDQEGLGYLSLDAVHALVLSRRAMPIASLAHRLRVSPQATSRVVQHLEKEGLVTKERDPLDSRARLVATTAAGDELLRDIRDQLVVTVRVVAEGVGEDRLAGLSDELGELALIEADPPMW
jgi:DNA-binding MarR family transcriptional regulator